MLVYFLTVIAKLSENIKMLWQHIIKTQWCYFSDSFSLKKDVFAFYTIF